MVKRNPKAATDLFDLAESLCQEDEERNRVWDGYEALYDMEKKQSNVEGESKDHVKRVTMPYASSTINMVSDLASQMKEGLKVPANKETEGAKKTADEQEEWIRQWKSLNEMTTGHNFTSLIAWQLGLFGCTIIKTPYDDKAVTGKGDDWNVTSVPVVIQIRDPRNVHWIEGIRGFECVVERFSRGARSIKYLYPDIDLAAAGVSDDEESVTWTEYWDKDVRCYWVNGELVRGRGRGVWKHGYGIIPYSIGVGRVTPRRGPKRYIPLLAPIESTVKNLDTWFSILATAGWSAVTSAFNVYSDAYGRDEGKVLLTGPGDVNYLSPADKVEPMQRAGLPPDFFQLGNLWLQAFQQATFPFALYGESPGNMAGYAINLLTNAGRRPLVPIWTGIERTWKRAFKNTVLLIRNKVAPIVGERVPLMITAGSAEAGYVRRKVTLDTGEIGDDWDIVVTLDDPLPQDEATNLRMAIESTSGDRPLLSQETAMEKYKVVEDSIKEQERKDIEWIMTKLRETHAIRLAQEKGYLDKIVVPPGFHAMPDGTLMPDAFMPEPTLQQPTPSPGMVQAGPSSLVPGMAPQGAPNIADLQQMMGQGQPMPDMATMAGVPPELNARPGIEGAYQ